MTKRLFIGVTCLLGFVTLFIPNTGFAQSTCRVVAGQRVVVVESTTPGVSRGRLCAEGRCNDILIRQGIGSARVEFRTGDVISFVPADGGRGCVAIGDRRAPWHVASLPQIITGAFTLMAGMAGLFGAFGLELFRSRRDRTVRSLEWIENYRRKLVALKVDQNADVVAPPMPSVDRDGCVVLRAIQSQVEAVIVELARDAPRATRVDVVDRALAILDTKRKL